MEQQHLVRRGDVLVEVADGQLQRGRDLERVDLGPVPEPLEPPLEVQHLLRDRVTLGRAGVELVDRRGLRDHLRATSGVVLVPEDRVEQGPGRRALRRLRQGLDHLERGVGAAGQDLHRREPGGLAQEGQGRRVDRAHVRQVGVEPVAQREHRPRVDRLEHHRRAGAQHAVGGRDQPDQRLRREVLDDLRGEDPVDRLGFEGLQPEHRIGLDDVEVLAAAQGEHPDVGVDPDGLEAGLLEQLEHLPAAAADVDDAAVLQGIPEQRQVRPLQLLELAGRAAEPVLEGGVVERRDGVGRRTVRELSGHRRTRGGELAAHRLDASGDGPDGDVQVADLEVQSGQLALLLVEHGARHRLDLTLASSLRGRHGLDHALDALDRLGQALQLDGLLPDGVGRLRRRPRGRGVEVDLRRPARLDVPGRQLAHDPLHEAGDLAPQAGPARDLGRSEQLEALVQDLGPLPGQVRATSPGMRRQVAR